MNPQFKISFIIPVYNTEPYLFKCVDSILTQDYDNIEIILVDDGSTDNSPQICDEYTKKYVNIRTIHQSNAGQSVARNNGLAVAQGEYVCFLDSDDYWQPNALGTMMSQIEREKLDVLRFDYQNVRINADGQYEIFQPDKYPHVADQCTEVVTGEKYLNERMDYSGYVAMFIIRRELVSEFIPGIHFEDAEWQPRMLLQAKRVNSTTQVVYNYLIRKGSTSHFQTEFDAIKKNNEDRLYVIQQFKNLFNQFPNCRWLRNMQSRLALATITSVAQYHYNERDEYLQRLRDLDVFPLTIANQGKTYIRKARLMNISVRMTVFLLYLRNVIGHYCEREKC